MYRFDPHPTTAACLLAIATIVGWSPSHAASVQLFEHSASSIASAGVNQAEAKDASALFWNAANLTQLPGRNLSGALHLLQPTGAPSDIDARATLSGAPIGGGNGGAPGILTPAGSFYFTTALDHDTTVGFGMTAPFGLAQEFPAEWSGRYQALEAKMLTLDLGLSAGHRLTPTLSVGVGVDLQYVKTKLGNAIDLSTVCLAVASQVGAGLTDQCVGGGFGTPGNAAADGRVTLSQDDWSPGWNAGLLWHPTPDVRVGLAYRSQVNHQLHGDATFFKPASLPGAIGNLPDLTSGTARTALRLPANATVSAFYRVNAAWSVTGAVTWTHWSVDQELRTRFDNGAPDSVVALNWKNTWRVGGALAYRASSALTLRGGIAFDQTPTTGANHQTLLIPDANRWVFGLGGSYALSQPLSLDFGITRYALQNLPIVQNGVLQGSFQGRYPHAGISVASIQANYRF